VTVFVIVGETIVWAVRLSRVGFMNLIPGSPTCALASTVTMSLRGPTRVMRMDAVPDAPVVTTTVRSAVPESLALRRRSVTRTPANPWPVPGTMTAILRRAVVPKFEPSPFRVISRSGCAVMPVTSFMVVWSAENAALVPGSMAGIAIPYATVSYSSFAATPSWSPVNRPDTPERNQPRTSALERANPRLARRLVDTPAGGPVATYPSLGAGYAPPDAGRAAHMPHPTAVGRPSPYSP
jgi:hypothetical protein